MKKTKLSIRIKDQEPDPNAKKKIYISNVYDVFTRLRHSVGIDSNNALNDLSEEVLRKGKCLRIDSIEKDIQKHAMLYDNQVFIYIVNYHVKTAYFLLIDYFAKQELYKPAYKVFSCRDLLDISRHNSYEAFLNYAKYNGFPPTKGGAFVFYRDFEDSLFSADVDDYKKDAFFNFYTVENRNRPGEYFFFLVSNNTIYITQYKDFMTFNKPKRQEVQAGSTAEEDEGF